MFPAQKMEPATLRKFEYFEVGPLLPKLPFGKEELFNFQLLLPKVVQQRKNYFSKQ